MSAIHRRSNFFELAEKSEISEPTSELDKRQAHPCPLWNRKRSTALLLLTIPHYLAPFFVLRDFNCFPVHDEIVATVTDVDLVLLYPWKIECSSHHAAIMRFAESSSEHKVNKLHLSTMEIMKATHIDFRFFIFCFGSGL